MRLIILLVVIFVIKNYIAQSKGRKTENRNATKNSVGNATRKVADEILKEVQEKEKRDLEKRRQEENRKKLTKEQERKNKKQREKETTGKKSIDRKRREAQQRQNEIRERQEAAERQKAGSGQSFKRTAEAENKRREASATAKGKTGSNEIQNHIIASDRRDAVKTALTPNKKAATEFKLEHYLDPLTAPFYPGNEKETDKGKSFCVEDYLFPTLASFYPKTNISEE
ncbi:MAG: hypothetical protein Q4B70_08690 [Lachnospiraceae bacterium]|nr:hypothetical protein [Lachnospiraceae bacterium]